MKIKLTEAKLKNPELLIKDRDSISISDVNGLMVRIFRRKKCIKISFVHRCTINGKRKEIRLNVTSLTEARQLALNRMNLVLRRINPDSDDVREINLIEAIVEYISKKEKIWEPSTLLEFRKIINRYVSPEFDNVPLREINASFLKSKILDSIFIEGKFNTLRKLMSYLRLIMLHMCNLYPDRGYDDLHRIMYLYDIPPSKNFKSMTGDGSLKTIKKNIIEIFSKISAIKCKSLMNKIALELDFHLLIRVSELVTLKVSDVDFDMKVVHIRKTKTISEDEGGFTVPLSNHAIQLFKFALQLKKNSNSYIFESETKFGYVSERTLIDIFYRAELPMTIHGIRALGRTWLGVTKVPFEIAETCMSHKVGNRTVQAYVRSSFIEERRVVMEQWSSFLTKCSGKNSVIKEMKTEKSK